MQVRKQSADRVEITGKNTNPLLLQQVNATLVSSYTEASRTMIWLSLLCNNIVQFLTDYWNNNPILVIDWKALCSPMELTREPPQFELGQGLARVSSVSPKSSERRTKLSKFTAGAVQFSWLFLFRSSIGILQLFQGRRGSFLMHISPKAVFQTSDNQHTCCHVHNQSKWEEPCLKQHSGLQA